MERGGNLARLGGGRGHGMVCVWHLPPRRRVARDPKETQVSPEIHPEQIFPELCTPAVGSRGYNCQDQRSVAVDSLSKMCHK